MSDLVLHDSFPGNALVAALAVVKDKAVNTPAGQTQLLESGLALAYWGGLAMIGGTGHVRAAQPGEFTDAEAHDLLEQLTLDGDSDGTRVMVDCPISPAVALKLAAWLVRAAGIILPLVL